MRRAALLYNPASGSRRGRRARLMRELEALLRSEGVDAVAIATRAAGSGGEQAAEAVREGFDTVVACGGDGTLNEILQGVVGGGAARPILGLIPLGTGNVLAQNVGIPEDPIAAARLLLRSQPRRCAAGRAEFAQRGTGERRNRFFCVLAGVGVDAQLVYTVSAEMKGRFGMPAYYARGLDMVARHRMAPFEVEFTMIAGERKVATVTQAMAARLSYYGKALRRIAPGAALEREDFQFVLFKTAVKAHYLRYGLSTLLGASWNRPEVELVHGTTMECRSLPQADSSKIYAQADGEFLGCLPVRLSIERDAFTLLLPQK